MDKKIFVMSILSTFMLIGCGNETDNNQESSNDVEQTQVAEEQSDNTIDVESNSEPKDEYDEVDSRIDRIFFAKSILDDSFKGIGRVSYDYQYDIIQIMPTEPGFIKDIYRMMSGDANSNAWDSLSDNVAEMSIVISEIVDSDIKVAVLVPESEDKILLLVRDGTVIYNFIDEI